MKTLVFLSLTFFFYTNVSGQIVDLGTIQSGSFNDKTKIELKEQFKDARIIVLGEQTHGIGTEYIAFAQMVEFLHEEMGFNALVQEYCFFTSNQVNKQLQNGESAQSLRKTMYWPQGKAKEYDVLFDYLDEQRSIGASLNIEGFDSRIANRSKMKIWVNKTVRSYPSYSSDSNKPTKLITVLERVIDLEYKDSITTLSERKEIIEYLNFLIDYVTSVNDNKRDVQQLKSLLAFAKNAWNVDEYKSGDIRRYHYREHQMADNLMWLIDSVYGDEKVIVHMHNGHAAKNINQFHSYMNDGKGLKNITVGSILDKKYGSKCRIIGTTAYEGTYCKWDYKPIKIPVPHLESIETQLKSKGLKYVYMSFSDKTKEPFYMFFNDFNSWGSNSEIKAPYAKLFDGIIFFETVKAPTAIPVANSSK